MSLVLGFDPSLSHYGWAAVELAPGGGVGRVVEVGVVRTKPTPKKRREREADDQARRVREAAEYLSGVILRMNVPNILALAVESSVIPMRAFPGGGVKPLFTPTTMLALGRARGVLDGIAAHLRLPVLDYSPQEIKRFAVDLPSTVKEKITKAAVRAGMERRFPAVRALWPREEEVIEHAADALAVAALAASSDFVMGVCRVAASARSA